MVIYVYTCVHVPKYLVMLYVIYMFIYLFI